MNTIILAALLAVIQTGDSAIESTTSATKPREIHLIRREVSELLKAESAAASDAERARHVRRMTEVYLEIVRDDRWLVHPTLQQQRSKVWTRLSRVRDELKRQRTIDARAEQGPRSLSQREQEENEQQDRDLAAAMAAHLQLAAQTMGGSSALWAEAAGGGAVVDDFGDELIELIQSTIHPSHWNVNGGPGSIMYFRPCLALVVRANGEVHSRLGGAVEGLRAAGR